MFQWWSHRYVNLMSLWGTWSHRHTHFIDVNVKKKTLYVSVMNSQAPDQTKHQISKISGTFSYLWSTLTWALTYNNMALIQQVVFAGCVVSMLSRTHNDDVERHQELFHYAFSCWCLVQNWWWFWGWPWRVPLVFQLCAVQNWWWCWG